MDWLFPAVCIISGLLTGLAIPGILLAYGEAFGNPFARPSQPPRSHAGRAPVLYEPSTWPSCGLCCHRCCAEQNICDPYGHNIPITRTLMMVCQKCGNKRCPHATDHRNACTGSNEPGQSGSIYGEMTPELAAAVKYRERTKSDEWHPPVPETLWGEPQEREGGAA